MRIAALLPIIGLLTATATANAAPQSAMTSSTAHMAIDPVTDGALLTTSLAFALLLEGIVGTGELRPQEPVDESVLLGIDRWRAESDYVQDDNISNIGLLAMGAYVLADIVLVEALDRGDRWYEYLVVYGESAAITLAVTDLAKIAVRRPRPVAYRLARTGETQASTNTALSFFSGHASMAGALAGSATYLAWTRNSPTEAWIVTAGGGLLTALVSTMRVVEGKHFPSDVLAGALVGYAIGVLVPHMHVETPIAVSTQFVDGGATLGVSARF